MGTRGINVIVANGEIKCAQYNQWDSYPSGQGATALKFLKEEMKPDFKEKVLACSWITEEQYKQYWVDCGADPDSNMVGMDVSDKFKKKYLHLHRDCGAEIYSLIQNSKNGLKLQNDINFAADSLFCEWGYVVDLDKNTFEIYKGFNKEKLGQDERFAFLSEKADKEHRSEQYTPIKLVKSYDLSNLPTLEQFIEDLTEQEDDE
jgi:hypothetical protein